MSASPHKIGRSAEMRVKRILLDRGFTIYEPEIDVGVDFVVEPPVNKPHRFLAIQVRTSKYQEKSD